MKRVAYICADTGVPVFGRKGASVHVQEIIRALGQKGMQVELFASRVDGPSPPDLENVPVHKLPAPPKGDLAEREHASFAANSALRSALTAAGPYDLVYERYSLWSCEGMELAQEQKWPAVLEVNAPLIEEQAERRGLCDRAIAERAAECAFAAASVIICVSDGVAAWVRPRADRVSKVHVIPNGVDPRRFAAGTKALSPPAPGTFVVGFVGTLKPWHGLPVLAEAFAQLHARHDNTRLLVVGDGPGRAEMETFFASRKLTQAVHFTGAVAPNEVPGWLASMHAAVAPYPPLDDFYFSPLKVFEYLAAGLPVVASRIGQVAEILRDGDNGLLVPPGDATALASALGSLQSNVALGARLGASGRADVLKHHTWDATVARALKLAGI